MSDAAVRTRAGRTHIVVLAVVVVAWFYAWAPSAGVWAAPDDDEARNARESEESTRVIKAEQRNWKMWRGSGREHELTLEPKSVLRWTNPEMGRYYGDVFFWTYQGRPEVVMSIFKAWDPPDGLAVEMQSLSLGKVLGDRNARGFWAPSGPGISLQDVPDAAKPAGTAVRRLAQMRVLALDFTVVLTDQRRKKSGELQGLRMLTQPLLRYQSADAEWFDGAVFGFVLGTDPEAYLLLEARRTGETTKWQFGLGRMNPDSMAVSYKEREVGRFERLTSHDRNELYMIRVVPEAP